MNIVSDDIMTLNETAVYLKLAERTILKMVHNNEIPCLKVANQWRFIKPLIDDWLLSKINFIPEKNVEPGRSGVEQIVRVSRLIKSKFFIPKIRRGSKYDVLSQLVEPLLESRLLENKEVLLYKLIEREKLVSTGIGNGFAIPHVRNIEQNPVKENYLILGICEDGVNFEALDNNLTYLFLLIGTTNEILHLKLLSQISKLFHDSMLIDQILKEKSFNSIQNLIIKREYEVVL